MSVSKITLLAVLATFATALPASAQGYHYGYGSSRVVNQNSIGLNNHDASYISPGCISDSAKGVQRSGFRPNPLLPQVNLGRTVKTAGDNMYQGGAPYLETNSLYAPKPQVTRRRVSQQQRRPKGQVYYPGQNAQGGGSYKYSSGGAMTYGESENYQNSYSNNSGTYNYNR